MAPPTSKKEVQ
jgi:hypothetical protein